MHLPCLTPACLPCQVRCKRRQPGSAPQPQPQLQRPIEQRVQQAAPGAASSGRGATVQQASSRQQVCHTEQPNTSIQVLGRSCCLTLHHSTSGSGAAGPAESDGDAASGLRTPDSEPMYATSRLLTVRSKEELERVSQKARFC